MLTQNLFSQVNNSTVVIPINNSATCWLYPDPLNPFLWLWVNTGRSGRRFAPLETETWDHSIKTCNFWIPASPCALSLTLPQGSPSQVTHLQIQSHLQWDHFPDPRAGGQSSESSWGSCGGLRALRQERRGCAEAAGSCTSPVVKSHLCARLHLPARPGKAAGCRAQLHFPHHLSSSHFPSYVYFYTQFLAPLKQLKLFKLVQMKVFLHYHRYT